MRTVFGFLAFFVSSVLLAQAVEIPVTNWTVPPWTGSSGGITTMTDATPPRVFIGVQPCRLVDTRAGSAFPAGFGVPSLSAGVPRNFDLDNGPCPGLPSGIDAYSLNVTVTNTAGPGHLVIYPQGGAQPNVSSMNYVAGQTIANAVIVPAGTGGGVTVIAGVSGTNLLIDINGYFSETHGNPANFLELVNNSDAFTASFWNYSTTCSQACGIAVLTASGTAIYGVAMETNTDTNYGVHGQNNSSSANSAGVFGHAGNIIFPTGTFQQAGVRGVGSTGVMGISRNVGVSGILIDGAGASLAQGHLGYNVGPGYGVWAASNFGGTGAKYFVEPHPTDPSKVIRYVSLEGPEAGTYFRGRGKFERGIARIGVPEDFRMITDEEGLTVQVTPIGPMATVSVVRADLNEILVQSSRNVEFYFMVNGVRRTHKNLAPIGPGNEYMPERADSNMPAYLTEGQKHLLVQNGTYREDGTVNMETARRLGWDRIWAERERPVPSPTPE